MGRTILTVAASTAILAGLGPGGPEPATALPSWVCRVYCEAVHEGCKITLGRLDGDLCEDWYAGCKDGCRVEKLRD